MKKVIYLLLLAGMLGAGIGYYLFNKPVQSTEKMKPDFSMSTSELLAFFENDEKAANDKYLDKIIEVEGVIQKIDTKDEKTTVYLETDNMMSNVIFQLEKEEDGIEAGQHVKIKGVCTGYLMDVVLVRGVLV